MSTPPIYMIDTDRLALSNQMNHAAEQLELEASRWDLFIPAMYGKNVGTVSAADVRQSAEDLHRTARHVAEIARATLKNLDLHTADAYLWAAQKINRDAIAHRRLLTSTLATGRRA